MKSTSTVQDPDGCVEAFWFSKSRTTNHICKGKAPVDDRHGRGAFVGSSVVVVSLQCGSRCAFYSSSALSLYL